MTAERDTSPHDGVYTHFRYHPAPEGSSDEAGPDRLPGSAAGETTTTVYPALLRLVDSAAQSASRLQRTDQVAPIAPVSPMLASRAHLALMGTPRLRLSCDLSEDFWRRLWVEAHRGRTHPGRRFLRFLPIRRQRPGLAQGELCSGRD